MTTDQTKPGPTAGAKTAPGLICAECAYDLRLIDSAGKCPECGLPLAESRTSYELLGCNRAWFKRVARGARFLLAADVPGVVGMALGPDSCVSVVGLFGAGILLVLGGFAVSEREPGRPERWSEDLMREGARYGPCFAVLLVIGGFGAGRMIGPRSIEDWMWIPLWLAAAMVVRRLSHLYRPVPGGTRFLTTALPAVLCLIAGLLPAAYIVRGIPYVSHFMHLFLGPFRESAEYVNLAVAASALCVAALCVEVIQTARACAAGRKQR